MAALFKSMPSLTDGVCIELLTRLRHKVVRYPASYGVSQGLGIVGITGLAMTAFYDACGRRRAARLLGTPGLVMI
jgi:hypothetical protein